MKVISSVFLSINWLKNHRNYYWTYLFLYVTQKASYYANCKMVLTLRNNTSLSLGYSKEKCARHSWIQHFSCQTNHISVCLWHFTIIYDSELSFNSLFPTVLHKYIIYFEYTWFWNVFTKGPCQYVYTLQKRKPSFIAILVIYVHHMGIKDSK